MNQWGRGQICIPLWSLPSDLLGRLSQVTFLPLLQIPAMRTGDNDHSSDAVRINEIIFIKQFELPGRKALCENKGGGELLGKTFHLRISKPFTKRNSAIFSTRLRSTPLPPVQKEE